MVDLRNGIQPDPEQAGSLAEFIELLEQLRRWAGSPSYRTLAKRVGPLLVPPQTVSQSTLTDLFQPRRRRLKLDLVVAIVRALGLDAPAVARWRAACVALHADGKDRGSGRVPRQLPADLATFTGRASELRAILGATGEIPDCGSVVISAIDGMAGVGKSALAIRAAHLLSDRFPDGQLFLDLHGYTQGMAPRDPAGALDLLLTSLGVPPGKIPAELDARATFYRERLAGTRTLVLLDNAATEAQIRPLIPGNSECLVLITSRKRLKGLDEARTVALDVLPETDAVAVLRALVEPTRAPADDPGWQQIAQLCGCLPLALRIAAALIRHRPAWTLGHLADKLRAAPLDLGSFTDGERDMSAMFDLSYQSLAGDQQDLLRRLGLAPGPDIDAYAAAALLGTAPARAERLLQGLVDHHLLAEPAPGRYRMHDLVRAYAHTQAMALDPGSVRDHALDCLLHYYAHTAQTVSHAIARYPRPEPTGPNPAHAPDLGDPDAARAWLRAEQPNLDAAFTHAHTHRLDGRTVALAAGLADILHTDGPWSRAMDVHRIAAETAERRGWPAAHATALTDLGRVRYQTGNYESAGEPLIRAVEVQRDIGNRLGEAHALTDLGRVQMQIGNYLGAVDTLTRALEIFREIDSRNGEAHALSALGRARYQIGDQPGATDALTGALRIFREIGSHSGEAYALTALGRVRLQIGDFSGAGDVLTRALEIYRDLGHRGGEAHALFELGRVQFLTGDLPRADDTLTRALDIFRETGGRNGEAFVMAELGRVQFLTGDFPGATGTFTKALEIFHEIGHRNGEATALTELGRVRLQTGHHPGSVDALTRALEIYREIGSRSGEAWATNHYAAAISATGDRSRALALYQQALAMNREFDKPDDEAISLEGIADHHLTAGETLQGTTHLREALEIYQRLGMSADVTRLQTRLADLPKSQRSSP
ncbi:tetratricopeptide repeat protein [Catenulispora subtropica]|uniref:Tetratricopeptide repeat protein n=1 Tax=Catenulispora subtropica TaxID=450798 RepID=A0ABN2R0T9_9ACTN